MDQQHIQDLYRKFVDGDCSQQDIALLLDHFQLMQNDGLLSKLIEKELSTIPPAEWVEDEHVQEVYDRVEKRLLDNIRKQAPRPKPLRIAYLRYTGIAASILLILAVAYLFKVKSVYQNTDKIVVNDALPGGNRATLTLADGTILNLDKAVNGEIANEQGILIRKTSDGTVLYETNKDSEEDHSISYNTVTTPKGGQYRIILADGSQVWLNAGSSLKYPTKFFPNERRVVLSGEAYFEVAKDKGKPFIVSSEKQQVEVLGTHFNINAYINETSTKTTLLEGSVRVSQIGIIKSEETLKPGEQSVVAENIRVVSTDVTQAVAWKDGQFNFQDMSLKEVMRQLERWYDVEVDYTGMPDIEFVGSVPRNAKLSSVLKALEVTSNVKFKIEERRISMTK